MARSLAAIIVILSWLAAETSLAAERAFGPQSTHQSQFAEAPGTLCDHLIRRGSGNGNGNGNAGSWNGNANQGSNNGNRNVGSGNGNAGVGDNVGNGIGRAWIVC